MSELKAYNVVATADVNPDVVDNLGCTEWAGYDKDEVDEAIAEMKEENATLRGANDEKTERIVELQKQVDKLDGVKKSAELILLNLLDCGLIKEWYFNGKFNAILKADDPHLKIAELKQKLEDAGMENRRLKRALWLARAERAKECHFMWCQLIYERKYGIVKFNVKKEWGLNIKQGQTLHTPQGWADVWDEVERKCRAKAEEYK